ncbi:MAG: hypothetical protein H7329_02435, partial [Opitutaceae bacterium]|nr:hypothetical protein [Cytophagales bacterium]
MKFLFVLAFSFYSFSIFAQSTVSLFDVTMNDKKIGVLKATKNINGKMVTKNISSNSKTNVLTLSVHVESEVYVTSENDILKTSFAYRQVSHGSENIETTVKFLAPSKYKIVKNGVISVISSNINYSIVDLYFKEPKGLNTVFSNTHGAFLIIKPLGKGDYELQLPDGKTN